MISKWRWAGAGLILVSILFILLVIFPGTIVSDADTKLGPIQVNFIILFFFTALLGIRISQIVTKTSELKEVFNQFWFVLILCLLGLALNLISFRVFIPGGWRPQIRSLRWVINWLVLTIALYKIFIWRNEKFIGRAVVKKLAPVFVFIQHNYWIIIVLGIAALSLVSDVFSGVVRAYTLFLAMGFGFSLWLISPNGRMTLAPAFAPIIGYSIVSVFGSWLVMLDLPVKEWTASYTVVVVLLNLLFALAWIKKNPSWENQIAWKSALNDLSIGYFAIILIILPVVIGDMRFSTFRGNQDDAHNYMSMAYYLAGTKFSLHENLEMLFQLNPALYLGGLVLSTRWSSSMLMAYSSIVAGIPIYRFDFAFSTLPFALLMAPIYKTLKEIGLDVRFLFFLVIGISAGYYGQVVLDSRAVSYCTSLPVVLAFVILLARIWDDGESTFKGLPIYLGELLLLTIFILALFVLYPEILTILGLGIFIGALYYVLYKSFQIKKTILLFLSAAFSALIIYITLPIYIKFLVQQITGSQNMYVPWHMHFFAWIFYDFPAGLWALNPYQINEALSPIIQFYAYVLTVILIVTWGVLIFRRSEANTMVQMSGFIMTAGAILFAYMYFRGQYWQAGKMFTYVYPFTMIFVAFIPHELKALKLPKFPASLHLILEALILCWLALVAGSSVYRFVIVARGTTYPFYLGGTGHGFEDYKLIYNWDIQSFMDILKKPDTVVWLASDSAAQDIIWSLSMDPEIKVFNTHPIIGNAAQAIALNQTFLSTNLPDYLIVSNDIWNWNKNTSQITPILFDQEFSLINIARKLPDVPLLIGMRNDPTYHYNGDYWIGQEGWLVFLSPAKCEAIFSGDALTVDEYPSLDILIDSEPFNKGTVVSLVDKQPFQFPVLLEEGYNFVPIKISEGFLQDSQSWTPVAYFQNMTINYTCDIK